MINEEYLIDKWHKSERKLKLKLIKDDQAAFEIIYSDMKAHVLERLQAYVERFMGLGA